ncbi:MAG: flagellar hook-associated protein FlgL [Gemmatimonadaceae bacterium]
MRITNSYIRDNSLANMQSNMRAISETQSQISSGRRIQRTSDDPAASANVMRAGGSLRALDTYKRNITSAESRVQAEETAVNSLIDILTRVKTLAVSQASDTANSQTRAATKTEVDSLMKQAVQLGNTKFGDGYLFGGVRSQSAPFDPTQPGFAAAPPSGERLVEALASQLLKSTHNGRQVFLDSGALAAIKELSVALGADDTGKISQSSATIDASFASVQDVLGDFGARSNQLQVTSSNLDALKINLQTFESNLQDVDLEKAVTDMVSRQTAYQAAMLATSKVMGMTLTDYLR